MDLCAHGSALQVDPRKFYVIRLDAVLLTLQKLYPNELSDFNSKLLHANIENSDVDIRKVTARFWVGGLPCVKSVRSSTGVDDVSVTELMEYNELPQEHLKQQRCVAFPKLSVDRANAGDGGGPVDNYKALAIPLVRRDRLSGGRVTRDVPLYDEIVDGVWKGFRVLPDKPVDSDDSSLDGDDECDITGGDAIGGTATAKSRQIKRMCNQPADPADALLETAQSILEEDSQPGQVYYGEYGNSTPPHASVSDAMDATEYGQGTPGRCIACELNLPLSDEGHCCDACLFSDDERLS